MKRYRCNCCGHYTLEHIPNGSYEICPVCFWEDAPFALENPEEECACNRVSLNTARKNYLEFGACCTEVKEYVRKPMEEEVEVESE